jgi:aminoglycoside phosphotransferase (APT) family kinase protein
MVRSGIPAADEMDLRLLDEVATLHAIAGRVRAPRVWLNDPRGRFFICSYVGDETLDEVAPDRTAITIDQMRSIVAAVVSLASVPTARFRRGQEAALALMGLPAASTHETVRAHLLRIAADVFGRFPELAGRLALPTPEDLATALFPCDSSRPEQLIHCDLHRKNLRTGAPRGGLYILDWELAMVGDPMYDLAVHLHRMEYPAGQREACISAWREEAIPRGWSDNDLRAYLAIEKSKSAYVDLVRGMQTVLSGATDPDSAAGTYEAKLRDLALVTGTAVPTATRIAALFRAEAEQGRPC